MRHLFIFVLLSTIYCLLPTITPVYAAPTIGPVSVNTPGIVSQYNKMEFTFPVSTVATNTFFPFDLSPPNGITPAQGITVNAIFTNPSGQVHTYPAFYYQDFNYQVITTWKGPTDWMYPLMAYKWMVRFTPTQVGTWHYHLTAQDSTGTASSSEQTFTVDPNSNPDKHGFVIVSDTDKRYFDFQDDTFFPGLGYNLNFNQVSWDNPVQENLSNFQKMNQNGIQLIRIWLSQWGVFGSYMTAWQSITNQYFTNLHVGNEPGQVVAPGSDASMALIWSNDYTAYEGNPCMFVGWMWAQLAVKRSTSYHLSVRYRLPNDLIGPNIANQPYGLVAKFGPWLEGQTLAPGDSWRTKQVCAYPTALVNQYNNEKETLLTSYVHTATSGWSSLEADFTSNDYMDFLPYLWLAVENISGNPAAGNGNAAFIDMVEIRENLPGGGLGINILPKSWMSQDQYIDQSHAYSFDKMLELAEQNQIYFKATVMDKNDSILNSYNYDGTPHDYDSTWELFYGNRTKNTRTYWLQQAWWRYLQARWGYSTSIHSWELLNEGTPWSASLFTLAENFAQYMHQFTPNQHLITTSFWGDYSFDSFWNNPQYSSLDYVENHLGYKTINNTEKVAIDFHGINYNPTLYIPNDFYDTAMINYKTANLFGTIGTYGIRTKPTSEGEFGFTLTDADHSDPTVFAADTQGIWLHNYVWGHNNSFGLYDASYFYPTKHIYSPEYTGASYDFRSIFGTYSRFLANIPMSNGHYVDAGATSTAPTLRVWGQKDIVNNRAHLWISNPNHTWKNVVDNVTIAPITATITLPGFSITTPLKIEWWNTYTGTVTSTTTSTPINGTITLSINNLTTDTAVKIGDYVDSTSPPTDYRTFLDFLPTFNLPATIFDFNTLLKNLFR
jgi:hypothetical protein